MRAPSTRVDVADASRADRVPAGDRPTVAQIDLDALAHNFAEARRCAGGRQILAMVKAQAYGHGAVGVSRKLAELGADMLGVALVEEGMELRNNGIKLPILVMGPVFPDQATAVVKAGLTPVVVARPLAQALSAAAVRAGMTQKVHVKVDTGMGRLGLTPEDAAGFIAELAGLPGIMIEGVMTHFADADLRDKEFAARQIDRFERVLRDLEVRSIPVPLRHAANSAAVLEYDRALFTVVRPGIMLYGYNPLESRAPADLRPVLSLSTRIAFLKTVPAGTSISYGRTFMTKRESVIATVPLGYADGFPRDLSNRGEMLVRGKRAPVAGRVCMDMTMLDVTDIPGVETGDVAIAIGAQGRERITAEDVASLTGTISYEVLCGISSRVPRSYSGESHVRGAE